MLDWVAPLLSAVRKTNSLSHCSARVVIVDLLASNCASALSQCFLTLVTLSGALISIRAS
jgi:hypothetical protein